MNYLAVKDHDIEKLLQPETSLEQKILEHPDVRKGLLWGKPRFGHPEGKVLLHAREVLDNVDKMEVDKITRSRLRLIAIIHDTFKYKELHTKPRDWSRHHAVIAREFLEQFTDDTSVLKVLELHDEAFYCWRNIHIRHRKEAGQKQLEQLLERLGNDLRLFYLFYICDTQTGDKFQAPLEWFTDIIEQKGEIGDLAD
jgi:hypothetical protein